MHSRYRDQDWAAQTSMRNRGWCEESNKMRTAEASWTSSELRCVVVHLHLSPWSALIWWVCPRNGKKHIPETSKETDVPTHLPWSDTATISLRVCVCVREGERGRDVHACLHLLRSRTAGAADRLSTPRCPAFAAGPCGCIWPSACPVCGGEVLPLWSGTSPWSGCRAPTPCLPRPRWSTGAIPDGRVSLSLSLCLSFSPSLSLSLSLSGVSVLPSLPPCLCLSVSLRPPLSVAVPVWRSLSPSLPPSLSLCLTLTRCCCFLLPLYLSPAHSLLCPGLLTTSILGRIVIQIACMNVSVFDWIFFWISVKQNKHIVYPVVLEKTKILLHHIVSPTIVIRRGKGTFSQ